MKRLKELELINKRGLGEINSPLDFRKGGKGID